MSAPADRPTLASETIKRVLTALDQGAEEAGLPSYSLLAADNALHAAGFEKAVHERAVGLVRAENWRMRIALAATRSDARKIADLIAAGRCVKAQELAERSARILEQHTHVMKRRPLPPGVADMTSARCRPDTS
ncbi:hypothetical protein [Methylobacterium fujisawaense]